MEPLVPAQPGFGTREATQQRPDRAGGAGHLDGREGGAQPPPTPLQSPGGRSPPPGRQPSRAPGAMRPLLGLVLALLCAAGAGPSEPHYAAGEHRADYDREALLGGEVRPGAGGRAGGDCRARPCRGAGLPRVGGPSFPGAAARGSGRGRSSWACAKSRSITGLVPGP